MGVSLPSISLTLSSSLEPSTANIAHLLSLLQMWQGHDGGLEVGSACQQLDFFIAITSRGDLHFQSRFESDGVQIIISADLSPTRAKA